MKKITLLLILLLITGFSIFGGPKDLNDKLEIGHDLDIGYIAIPLNINSQAVNLDFKPDFYFYSDGLFAIHFGPGLGIKYLYSETEPIMLSELEIRSSYNTGIFMPLSVTDFFSVSPGIDLSSYFVYTWTKTAVYNQPDYDRENIYTDLTLGIVPYITVRYFVQDYIALYGRISTPYSFFSSYGSKDAKANESTENNIILFPEPNKQLHFSFGLSFFL